MPLSTEIISQFAKIVTPKETRPEFTTVTGRATEYAGKMYVKIDGSDQLTPIASSTVGLKNNDWVTVQIKNHSATVTGNATDPSAGQSYADDIKNQVDDAVDQITEFEIIIANKADIADLNAANGRIDNLITENVTIKERLTATEADIGTLEAGKADIEDLTAINASIENLETTKLDASIADITYATIENLEATNADIHNLEADYGSFKQLTTDNFTAVNGSISNLEANKLDVEQADLKYANIDFANIGSAAIENFFSKSGMIEDLVVGSGTITGHLVGVTISGDLIEGNTIKADKLVVLGDDGLYYKLNVTGESVAAEQTEYNSLNGSIITANTITAEKINVNDLVAFNATIGGFKITDSSLYSGVKESVDNTTRGTYMDDQGQFAVGDESNYIKFFKDTDDTWKLAISANAIKFGTSQKDIETVINEVQDTVEGLETPDIGARNLLINSHVRAEGSGVPLASWNLAEAPKVGETLTFSMKGTLDSTLDEFRIFNSGGDVFLCSLVQNGDLFTGTFEWTNGIGETAIGTPAFVALYNYPLSMDGTNPDTVNNVVEWAKLERGTVPTDWTPAPEDLATSDEVDDIQDTVDSTVDRVTTAEASLELLGNSIRSLVTDENGSSLMTQTSNGWTFNIGGLQSDVETVSTQVNEVIGDMDAVNSLAQQTNDLANDLAEKTAYITMSQDDEGNPVMELGRADSLFRIRITNSSIDFMEGTQRIAYITNKQLYIRSSVVTDEMKIGATSGYIWKKRGNNHMGLRWVTE